MMTNGTLIQLNEGGDLCLIENLHIGQHVLSPFSEATTEIIDILTRTVQVPSTTDAWRPVEIPVGLIEKSRPFAPLVVSPKQLIMKKRQRSGSKIPEIDVVAASKIKGATKSHCDEVTYSAIFLEKSIPIVANGVLCMSYSGDVYK